MSRIRIASQGSGGGVQTLSLSMNELSISGGNSVTMDYNKWHVFNENPHLILPGNPDDLCIDTSTGDVYRSLGNYDWTYETNLKGNEGTPGSQGLDGNQWFTGSGDPNGVFTANDGDMYLDTDTSDVYRCAGAESWAYQTNVKGDTGDQGPQGEPGSKVFAMDYEPIPANEGDVWFNNITGEMSIYESGNWVLKMQFQLSS